MQLPNGSSYEGDFKNGEITGNGLRDGQTVGPILDRSNLEK